MLLFLPSPKCWCQWNRQREREKHSFLHSVLGQLPTFPPKVLSLSSAATMGGWEIPNIVGDLSAEADSLFHAVRVSSSCLLCCFFSFSSSPRCSVWAGTRFQCVGRHPEFYGVPGSLCPSPIPWELWGVRLIPKPSAAPRSLCRQVPMHKHDPWAGEVGGCLEA